MTSDDLRVRARLRRQIQEDLAELRGPACLGVVGVPRAEQKRRVRREGPRGLHVGRDGEHLPWIPGAPSERPHAYPVRVVLPQSEAHAAARAVYPVRVMLPGATR